MKLVVCETVAAISTHLRDVGEVPINYGGHMLPRPKALCKAQIAWDTRLPISATRCTVCLRVLAKLRALGQA